MAVEDSGTSPAGEAGQKNKGYDFLAYGLSNPPVLLIGGLFLGVDMLLDKFLAGKFGTINTGISLLPSINLVYEAVNALVMILVLGYLMGCIRELANGNYRMPSISKDLRYLRDGAAAFAIQVAYILPAMLIMVFSLTIPQIFTPLAYMICILSFVLLIIGSVTAIFLLYSGLISLAFYANDGDFFLAINPIVGVARSLSHIGQFILVIIRAIIVGMPLVVVSYVCKFVPLIEILSPWARFYTLTALAFIVYEFYRYVYKGKTVKKHDIGPDIGSALP